MDRVVSCATVRFSLPGFNREWYGNYLQRAFNSAGRQHAGHGHRTVRDQCFGLCISQHHDSGATPNPDIALG